MVTLIPEPMHARPRPEDQLARLFAGGWPEFIVHDQETRRYIGRIRALFADLELVLLEDDEIVAAGWAVPLRWNGRAGDLVYSSAVWYPRILDRNAIFVPSGDGAGLTCVSLLVSVTSWSMSYEFARFTAGRYGVLGYEPW
jgi:hypothetical protein